MAEDNDDSTTFFRQRRDLFVISSILLLIPLANIQIEDHISMQQFGMTLFIGKPQVITYALWALWVYWYLRYLQAYRSLNQSFLRNKLNSEMSSTLYSMFHKLASIEQTKLIKNGLLSNNANQASFTFKSQTYRLLKSEYLTEFSSYDSESGTTSPISKVITYSGFGYTFKLMKVTLKCLIVNIEATEYLLPFFYGLCPLIYFLSTNLN